MPALIAIVEDDADQRHNYATAVRQKGYRTAEYASRKQAAAGIQRELPDLVILDIILQDEVDGGFNLCRELLASYPGLPVLFLTERIDEIDKISGLRLGAWDYQPKPISLGFLAERVASLLRLAELRNQPVNTDAATVIGSLSINDSTMQAEWKNQRIPMTVTEFRLLQHLLRHPGHAVSYDSLMSATKQQYVTANTINTHMRNIRRKFCKIDADFSAINNEYGFGYRWYENS
ncbi:MAG: response regulator transcription factor [Pseudomonadales bacterium]